MFPRTNTIQEKPFLVSQSFGKEGQGGPTCQNSSLSSQPGSPAPTCICRAAWSPWSHPWATTAWASLSPPHPSFSHCQVSQGMNVFNQAQTTSTHFSKGEGESIVFVNLTAKGTRKELLPCIRKERCSKLFLFFVLNVPKTDYFNFQFKCVSQSVDL